jgi:hypothetical protein
MTAADERDAPAKAGQEAVVVEGHEGGDAPAEANPRGRGGPFPFGMPAVVVVGVGVLGGSGAPAGGTRSRGWLEPRARSPYCAPGAGHGDSVRRRRRWCSGRWREGRFDQGRVEPAIAVACPARPVFVRALVIAGARAAPTGEDGHVDASSAMTTSAGVCSRRGWMQRPTRAAKRAASRWHSGPGAWENAIGTRT